MEIVTTPFQVIFEKIVDYTIGVVARQMGYLICYRSNVDNLKTQVNELKDARQSVEDKVKVATNNVEEIEANVLKWLTCVEEITTEVHKFFEEEGQAKLKCCHDWCPNLKARYQLSKRAYKMGLDVKKIQDKGIFPTIGHRVPIRGVTPISTKGFEDFESRKTILEGIMKALKDDNIHAIGVCGMGGLDDIWNKLDLEALGIYFGDDQNGSKLLLTSRFRNVLETDMDAQQLFDVGLLSKNEAEYLFAKIVGDLPETLNLQPTMVEVVKECAGLPIAIRAVANALKNQKNLNVWKDALRELKRANPTQIKGMHEKVYPSIKLSYNFLTKEAQSLFLFCSSFEEDMNIEIAFLWRILVGLEFFQDVYRVEEVRNRVHTLVESLKASGLLLDGNGSGTFKMHDIIRDVAIYIADKEKKILTIRTSDDLEKWSNKKLLKDFIGISLSDVKFSELPKKLDDAQPNFIFLYDKDNSSPIPNHFFERVKELRVLVLQGLCLPLPSSLSCLHNLQALVLHRCEIEDVAIIGELKKLKALTISTSIKKLPVEIGQLTHLQLLDLKGCNQLEVIPCNMLSNLKRLEELYMNGSFNQWHVDGESTERSNARVLELDHLSLLTTLCIHIPNAKILPKALLFEKLVRYKILIGSDWDWNDDSGQNEDEFKISKKLKIELDRNFQSEGGIKILLKSCEYLDLQPGKGIRSILHEVDQEGFSQLKHLYVRNSVEIQYVINSIRRSTGCVSYLGVNFSHQYEQFGKDMS
uniref:NB-ARC domain-containing protein n=1 Tax=Fagus sylvatica TaxID=28930 RepID=A0A2N9H8P4_FAGSY